MENAEIASILERSPTIAVIGAHRDPGRAAYYVADYLRRQGYRVLPVNPRFAGQQLFGTRVCASVRDLREPVDMVVLFRRADAVTDHVPEILAMRPRPRVVWMQLGIRNAQAARVLEGEGITVVQDRCTMAEHRRLALGPPRARGDGA